MTSLVLSVLVMTASGGLLSERTPAAGMLVGAVNLNAAATSLDHMSMEDLTAERARLLDTMPSMGLGIALTAVGGGVLLTGLILVATYVFELVIVGVVMMVASIPLLIIGPILIGRAARERNEVRTQVRLIDQRMAQMKRDELAPPPTQQNNETPPPPPMRPPGVEWLPVVVPQVLLARF